MGVKYTPQQQQVIDTRGCNLLVSAAAGSGKTAVLTERIVKMIGDETKPVDIDLYQCGSSGDAGKNQCGDSQKAGIGAGQWAFAKTGNFDT